MTNLVVRLTSEEDGQDLIEYGLLAALISIVCVLAVAAAGSAIDASYQGIAAGIP